MICYFSFYMIYYFSFNIFCYCRFYMMCYFKFYTICYFRYYMICYFWLYMKSYFKFYMIRYCTFRDLKTATWNVWRKRNWRKAFLTSAVDGGEWSASGPDSFNQKDKVSGTQWMGDHVGLRAGRTFWRREKILFLLGIELEFPGVQSLH